MEGWVVGWAVATAAVATARAGWAEEETAVAALEAVDWEVAAPVAERVVG